jgi:hypothetical protein
LFCERVRACPRFLSFLGSYDVGLAKKLRRDSRCGVDIDGS